MLLVTQTVAAIIAVGLRIYYGWQNKARDAAEKKEKESGELKQVANIEWLNCECTPIDLKERFINLCVVTDRENKTFRYRY